MYGNINNVSDKKGVLLNFLKITRSEAIDSSMLSNLTYNKLTRKLTATFTSGAVYDYFKVSRKDAKLLFNANSNGNSVGQLFDVLIKKDPSIEYQLVGKVLLV
tara:strand:+ start:446 stop:754 length:309 start_codon:yes stop_codon:yes gene_type:complete